MMTHRRWSRVDGYTSARRGTDDMPELNTVQLVTNIASRERESCIHSLSLSLAFVAVQLYLGRGEVQMGVNLLTSRAWFD